MHHVQVALIVLLLVPCSIGNIFQGDDEAEHISSSITDTRLPLDIVPVKYSINLHPNLTTLDFTGRTSIEVLCKKSTREILVHFKKLDLISVELKDKQGETVKLVSAQKVSKHEKIYIQVTESLKKGSLYFLDVEFRGNLSRNAEGFYRSTYTDKYGKVRTIAATQFEATHARSAFPCFDEPSMKAIFSLTMTRDQAHSVASNMPLNSSVARNDGHYDDIFEPSVKMSTYLVAFAVHDFKQIETTTNRGLKIRVLAREEAIGKGRYALRVAKKAMEFYEEFLGVKYPLPKLDLITIPDGGAMENWGLVTFTENSLLCDPITASAADQQLVTRIITHELAHNWFGNLVTMKWWSDLWLNEGFASYMEFLGSDSFAKDWKMKDMFVINRMGSAMAMDSLKNTHAVAVDIKDPVEIVDIFDPVTYGKGASMARMIHQFIGEGAFRQGLKKYLESRAYSNADSTDLWKDLSEASNINVGQIMKTWIKKPGFPMITISREGKDQTNQEESIEIFQKRFFSDDDMNREEIGEAWFIPFSYITQKNPRNIRNIWINGNKAFVNIPRDSGWIKGNVGQIGFYRVNYDRENWRKIIKQLKENHTVFSVTDRSGLIDDAFSFAKAGFLSSKTALQLTEYLTKETEFIPWSTTLRSLAYIGTMLSGRPSKDQFKKYLLQILKPVEEKLGWKDAGSMMNRLLREQVLKGLCENGDRKCVNKAKRKFSQLKKTPESMFRIPKAMEEIVYSTIVSYGGEEEWDILWNKYKNNRNERQRGKILRALTKSQLPSLLNRLLLQTLNSEAMRAHEVVDVMGTMAGQENGQTVVWEFLQTKFKNITERLGKDSMTIVRLLSWVTSSFNTKEQLVQVESFFRVNHEIFKKLKVTKQMKEKIQSNIKWMNTHLSDIESWLLKTTVESN